MSQHLSNFLKSCLGILLLVVVDVTITAPIMGATYRPFSWMSITAPDVETLYPVIRSISLDDPAGALPPGSSIGIRVSCDVTAGERYIFQRSTNLIDEDGWQSIAETNSAGNTISFVDTNPLTRAVFYRVQRNE